MTDDTFEIVHPTEAKITAEEARRRTDEIRGHAQKLWVGLLALYNDGAHIALGMTWGHYCRTEFDLHKSTASRVLSAGKVIEHLDGGTHRDSADGEVARGQLPHAERVARELVPAMREGGKQAVQEAWAEALEETNGKPPTADDVKRVVRRKHPKPTLPEPTQTTPEWAARMRKFSDQLDMLAIPLPPGTDRDELVDTMLGDVDALVRDLLALREESAVT